MTLEQKNQTIRRQVFIKPPIGSTFCGAIKNLEEETGEYVHLVLF